MLRQTKLSKNLGSGIENITRYICSNMRDGRYVHCFGSEAEKCVKGGVVVGGAVFRIASQGDNLGGIGGQA